MRRSSTRGFTLAEVLITLTIIGVIAALTIPSLIQNIQDAQLHTAWKKAYSDIDQATKKIMLDNAGSMKGIFTNTNNAKDTYKKYLNYVKDCNDSASAGICWHNANEYYYLYGSPYPLTGESSLVLNNNVLIAFHSAYPNCDNDVHTTGYKRCGTLYADVNGFKGPNTIGKDIQALYVLENRIIPTGIPNDFDWDKYCVGPGDPNYSTSYNGGFGCSAKYLYQ